MGAPFLPINTKVMAMYLFFVYFCTQSKLKEDRKIEH